jgi:hypothetical protein
VHTTAEMIYHLGRGPQSCMKWSDMDLDSHPYACYAPKFGWSMAIREEGGDTVARALVYTPAEGNAYFVRSYTKNDSFSHSDTILEAWLNSQGIRKRSDWDGAKLARVVVGSFDRVVFPYIDGEVKDVDDCGDYLLITENGEFRCDNTDGTADDTEMRTCDDCGSRESEDDGYWVGINDDSWVCESCRDNEYTYVAGRRGRHYYLHYDNIIEVNDNYYDPEYVSDNNIVQLHDGGYADLDDAVYIESEGEYYDSDDCDICCDHNGEYQLTDNCVELHNGEWCLTVDAWQCTHSDEWYVSGDDDYVTTADGDIIHPDYADECEMPEGYEVQPKTAHMTVTKEVAVEPVPFLPVSMSASPSAPSLRDEVIYDVDGLRVTKNYYMNIDLIRYQASKRVYERELCVAHNALRCDFAHEDGVEARIVANLCEQIANMEDELHRQFFQTEISRRYTAHLQAAMQQAAPAVEQAMTEAVMYGSSMVSMSNTGSSMRFSNIPSRFQYWGPSVCEQIRGHEMTHIVHDEIAVTPTTGE